MPEEEGRSSEPLVVKRVLPRRLIYRARTEDSPAIGTLACLKGARQRIRFGIYSLLRPGDDLSGYHLQLLHHVAHRNLLERGARHRFQDLPTECWYEVLGRRRGRHKKKGDEDKSLNHPFII